MSTKKTELDIEILPESLGVLLGFFNNIKGGLLNCKYGVVDVYELREACNNGRCLRRGQVLWNFRHIGTAGRNGEGMNMFPGELYGPLHIPVESVWCLNVWTQPK